VVRQYDSFESQFFGHSGMVEELVIRFEGKGKPEVHIHFLNISLRLAATYDSLPCNCLR
jgi:hypothetical protein